MMGKRFPIPQNGFAVAVGLVEGEATVYMARFRKGKRVSCTKVNPEDAEDLSRQLASAASRAAALRARAEE